MNESPDSLTDQSFCEFAEANYHNGQLSSEEEFAEDVSRFKHVKKLLTRYAETGDLKEGLILNHLLVLRNVFGEQFVRMAWLKFRDRMEAIKPFLVHMGEMPEVLYGVGGETIIYTDLVGLDARVVEALRELRQNG